MTKYQEYFCRRLSNHLFNTPHMSEIESGRSNRKGPLWQLILGSNKTNYLKWLVTTARYAILPGARTDLEKAELPHPQWPSPPIKNEGQGWNFEKQDHKNSLATTLRTGLLLNRKYYVRHVGDSLYNPTWVHYSLFLSQIPLPQISK